VNERPVADASVAATFGTVILPSDGSSEALAALPTAKALSARFSARLEILAVAPTADEGRVWSEHAMRALADVAGRSSVEVIIGADPAQAIVDRAESLSGALVCMSTRGRGRIAGAFIGSVTRSVAERSASPLVVVGPQADRPAWLVGPSRRRPENFPEPLSTGGILACVDGSADSETVLPVAARWSSMLGLPLSIVTVAEETVEDLRGNQPNAFGPADPQLYVDTLAGRWPGSVGAVLYDRIGVVPGLRSHMADQPVALVALAAHARRGLDRLRYGAMSAEIIATSTAPVLVVPMGPGGR
jgi:nucleotide-binding universal stress UspA family protein